ncbi:unnamed protein product, partial [Gongylonema pulchrum]
MAQGRSLPNPSRTASSILRLLLSDVRIMFPHSVTCVLCASTYCYNALQCGRSYILHLFPQSGVSVCARHNPYIRTEVRLLLLFGAILMRHFSFRISLLSILHCDGISECAQSVAATEKLPTYQQRCVK